MPSDKPEYRVYRARGGLLNRLLHRRESDRFRPLEEGSRQAEPAPRTPAGRAAGQGGAATLEPPQRAPEAPPRAPAPPGRRVGEPWWRRLTWKRVLLGVLGFVVFWTLLSFVLFLVSAHQQSTKVSDSTRAALDHSGNMLTGANNILLLGSDRRPGEKGPVRADTIMLMRYGGGKAARLSIPRDTQVSIPGHGTSKINAAYAYGGPPLMIETLKQWLGIEVNHVVEIDFTGFPKFVDALGGVNMTFGHCIVSRFEGRTIHFRRGKHHLNGKQALDVVRVRKNRCEPSESDLTRARRQQQFLEAVKGRLTSPLTFPRWPWVGWRAPRAIRSDMGGIELMELYWDIETSGKLKPRIMRPVNPGANPLQVSDAEKQAEVQRFLDG
jgi:LCP family protein required for cell wall assembly